MSDENSSTTPPSEGAKKTRKPRSKSQYMALRVDAIHQAGGDITAYTVAASGPTIKACEKQLEIPGEVIIVCVRKKVRVETITATVLRKEVK